MQLTDELRQHGVTLLNYASIREQSIGGFTQVKELSFGVQQKRLAIQLAACCSHAL